MHSCSTDKYSDRGKVHGAKWQNHSSSILPTKQLSAQPIGRDSVYKVFYTALSSRVCEHFGVQFKLGTAGCICLTVLDCIYYSVPHYKTGFLIFGHLVDYLQNHACYKHTQYIKMIIVLY